MAVVKHARCAAGLAAALLIAACGESGAGRTGAIATPALEGDDVIVAAAQTLSDSVGGCAPAADLRREARVVSLSDAVIVFVPCEEAGAMYSDRLFATANGQAPRLLALPDYGPSGWYAAYTVGMAELDAGSGVLTTLRSDGPNAACGSEGRYLWNGQTFAVDEIAWRGCDSGAGSGPPYPLIWPPQISSTVDPETATPAP